MATKDEEAKDAQPAADAEKPIEEQAREQTGQQQIQLRIDESKMETTYANAFRTNGTAEEVMLDFGLNIVGQGQEAQPQILFQIGQRVILNYLSAKRLAITLSQVIRRYEQQFGELELDVAKRRKDKPVVSPGETVNLGDGQ